MGVGSFVSTVKGVCFVSSKVIGFSCGLYSGSKETNIELLSSEIKWCICWTTVCVVSFRSSNFLSSYLAIN
jgi:hypothetical protein